jgi:hypothetical protein
MKKFFINLYRKFQQKKVDKINKKPVVVDELKWAMVVGHSKSEIGCVLKKKGKVVYTENAHSRGTIDKVHSGLMKITGESLTRAVRDGWGLEGAYSSLAQDGITASIESHRNAFNTKARGYEVWILKGDTLSKQYAEELINRMSKFFPTRINRGVKEVEAGGRGFVNLYEAKKAGMKVALLSELFFLDNESEFISEEDLAKVYIDFLQDKYI